MTFQTTFQINEETQSYPEKGRVSIGAVSVVFGKNANRTVALTTTDLTLDPGTFTALIGPSGCGKSTLLNAVAGFIEPTDGKIHVDTRQVLGPHPSVGVIFQSFALFPWFTARGNVEFALKRFGLNKEERRNRAIAALEEALGITAEKNMMPMQPGDVLATTADTTELRDWVGFAPNTDVRDGVKKFVDWYVAYHGRNSAD